MLPACKAGHPSKADDNFYSLPSYPASTSSNTIDLYSPLRQLITHAMRYGKFNLTSKQTVRTARHKNYYLAFDYVILKRVLANFSRHLFF